MNELVDFLLEQISEEERLALDLLHVLEGEVEEKYKGVVDEGGPFTPQRLLSAKLWAHFAGQSRWRNFKTGQDIAQLASPKRVLADCAAKRAVVGLFTPSDLESDDRGAYFYAEGVGDAVKALASAYVGHPRFKDEWLGGE